MSVYLGSRLRVEIPHVDLLPDGTTPAIDLSALSPAVVVLKPDGSALTGQTVTVTDAPTGEVYWEAAAGVLNAVGKWTLYGVIDGYFSDPIFWRVKPLPS